MMKNILPKKHFIFIFFTLIIFNLQAQIGGWHPKLVEKSNKTLRDMLNTNAKLKVFYNKAYAYAVFPKITKAGIGIGGAMGKGVVYLNNSIVGKSNLKQASVGFQFGGQQYSEIIFFQNKKAFSDFKNGNLKFDAQASAVALKEGVSINVAYNNGVAVFTKTIGGIMYEASIGGQHFEFKPK